LFLGIRIFLGSFPASKAGKNSNTVVSMFSKLIVQNWPGKNRVYPILERLVNCMGIKIPKH